MNLAASNLFNVEGRIALITGGTSGIGLMMAEGLIANGVKTLFIVGNEDDGIITGTIDRLLSMAMGMKTHCDIYGFVILNLIYLKIENERIYLLKKG